MKVTELDTPLLHFMVAFVGRRTVPSSLHLNFFLLNDRNNSIQPCRLLFFISLLYFCFLFPSYASVFCFPLMLLFLISLLCFYRQNPPQLLVHFRHPWSCIILSNLKHLLLQGLHLTIVQIVVKIQGILNLSLTEDWLQYLDLFPWAKWYYFLIT